MLAVVLALAFDCWHWVVVLVGALATDVLDGIVSWREADHRGEIELNDLVIPLLIAGLTPGVLSEVRSRLFQLVLDLRRERYIGVPILGRSDDDTILLVLLT